MLFLQSILCIRAQTNNTRAQDNTEFAKDTARFNECILLAKKNRETDLNKSMEYALEAKKIAFKYKSPSLMARAYVRLGIAYSDQNHIDASYECLLNSLTLYELLRDEKNKADPLSNIGGLYTDEGHYTEGIKYFCTALELYIKYGNDISAGICCQNISYSYEEMAAIDSARHYTKRALYYYSRVNDAGGIAAAKEQMGMDEMYNKEYAKAITLFLEAEKLYIESNNSSDLVYPYVYMAECFINTKNYNEAEKYANKALETARITGRIDLLEDSYKIKAKVAKEFYDFKTAYEYLSRSDSAATEIFETTHIDVSDVKSRFERKVKEEEVKLQRIQSEKIAETKKQNKIIYLLVIICAIIIGGGLNNRYKAKVRSEKRLADLNEELNQQNEEIAAQRDELEMQKHVVEEKNKDITDSIKYAKRIQEAILAPEAVLQEQFPQSFLFFKPREILSGDFYWFERFENKIYLIVADCVGHGVPGAFLSVACFNLVKQALHEHRKLKPSEILLQLHKDLSNSFKAKQNNSFNEAMDMAVCCFDTKTKELQYAGANIPLIIIRNTETGNRTLTELISEKVSLGKNIFNHEINCRDQSLILEKDDLVYVFTDGYADQFGGEFGKKLKQRNLRKLLLDTSYQKFSTHKQIVEEFFEEYKAAEEQTDDVLLIGIKFVAS